MSHLLGVFLQAIYRSQEEDYTRVDKVQRPDGEQQQQRKQQQQRLIVAGVHFAVIGGCRGGGGGERGPLSSGLVVRRLPLSSIHQGGGDRAGRQDRRRLPPVRQPPPRLRGLPGGGRGRPRAPPPPVCGRGGRAPLDCNCRHHSRGPPDPPRNSGDGADATRRPCANRKSAWTKEEECKCRSGSRRRRRRQQCLPSPSRHDPGHDSGRAKGAGPQPAHHRLRHHQLAHGRVQRLVIQARPLRGTAHSMQRH